MLLSSKSYFFRTNHKEELVALIRDNSAKVSILPATTVHHTRSFHENSLLIYKAPPFYKARLTQFTGFFILPLNLFIGYKLAFSLLSFKVIRSLFFSLTFGLTSNMLLKFLHMIRNVIQTIELHSSGKSVKISTYTGSFSVKVRSIRRVTEDEAAYFYTTLHEANLRFVPFIIKNELYLLPINSYYSDMPLVKAVLSGSEVKFS